MRYSQLLNEQRPMRGLHTARFIINRSSHHLIRPKPQTVPRTPYRTHRQSSFPPPLRASQSSYGLILVAVLGGGIAFQYWNKQDTSIRESSTTSIDPKSRTPLYAEMPIPEGTLGNLTPEQEQKLKEFWAIVLKTFGVHDQDTSRSEQAAAGSTAHSVHESDNQDKKKKSRLSIFGRKHDDKGTSAEEGDKYGQTAELKEILANQSPEVLRETYWTMLKADHPDQLLLRFLRARKWDVDRALAMLISTLHWRKDTMNVDEDVILAGEAGFLADEKSSDTTIQKEGHDFLQQLRMGKSFLHGTDKDGRPITYVRARLHRGGEQTERSLERYTVYVIETARLSLKAPVETACIVFDMTGFTMANMDYTPVKFMIKVFEANYPESLGAILVHKAPWVFNAIWKIIRGWLDPVVASKVHFTNNMEELSEFVPKNQAIKEVGGDEDWEYQYIEPVDGENKVMEDTTTRDQILQARKEEVSKFQQQTFDWIHATAKSEILEKVQNERNEVAQRLRDNYWKLDPYIRARSLYDRVGMIKPGGDIEFYPSHAIKKDNVE